MGRRYARMKSGELFDFETRTFISPRASRAIPSSQIDGDGSLIKGIVWALRMLAVYAGVAAIGIALAWVAIELGAANYVTSSERGQEAFSSYGSAHLDEGARLRALAR